MTQINISDTRRKEIKDTVYNALTHSKNYDLPVKIKKIVRSYKNIRLIPYSLHMKRLDISYKEMNLFAKTKDAFTDYYTDKGLYYIYYNDLDFNIVSSNRFRWNIAHELGHVLLNHHADNEKTRIFRSELSDAEYNILEAEADYFAQLLLVPHIVLYALKIKNQQQIRRICEISRPASYRRLKDYNTWMRSTNWSDTYDKSLFYHYYNFVYKRSCTNCTAKLIQRKGLYCPICGQKTLQWGDGDMIYPKLITYENGKLKECPNCKNEETDIEGGYCQICGRYLINRCINADCSIDILESNARYCPMCGESSLFYNGGILKDYDVDQQSGFMIIPDSVDVELPFSIDEELPFD